MPIKAPGRSPCTWLPIPVLPATGLTHFAAVIATTVAKSRYEMFAVKAFWSAAPRRRFLILTMLVF